MEHCDYTNIAPGTRTDTPAQGFQTSKDRRDFQEDRVDSLDKWCGQGYYRGALSI